MQVDIFDFDLDRSLIADKPAIPPAFWTFRKKAL